MPCQAMPGHAMNPNYINSPHERTHRRGRVPACRYQCVRSATRRKTQQHQHHQLRQGRNEMTLPGLGRMIVPDKKSRAKPACLLTTDLDGRLELQENGLLHENVPRLDAEHLNLRLQQLHLLPWPCPCCFKRRSTKKNVRRGGGGEMVRSSASNTRNERRPKYMQTVNNRLRYERRFRR